MVFSVKPLSLVKKETMWPPLSPLTKKQANHKCAGPGVRQAGARFREITFRQTIFHRRSRQMRQHTAKRLLVASFVATVSLSVMVFTSKPGSADSKPDCPGLPSHAD